MLRRDTNLRSLYPLRVSITREEIPMAAQKALFLYPLFYYVKPRRGLKDKCQGKKFNQILTFQFKKFDILSCL